MKYSPELTELLETHFDIVEAIVNDCDTVGTKMNSVVENQGRGGLYELAMDLTKEFMETYKDEIWGVTTEYQDTIELFLKEKLY